MSFTLETRFRFKRADINSVRFPPHHLMNRSGLARRAVVAIIITVIIAASGLLAGACMAHLTFNPLLRPYAQLPLMA